MCSSRNSLQKKSFTYLIPGDVCEHTNLPKITMLFNLIAHLINELLRQENVKIRVMYMTCMLLSIEHLYKKIFKRQTYSVKALCDPRLQIDQETPNKTSSISFLAGQKAFSCSLHGDAS